MSAEPLLRMSWTRGIAALKRYKWLAALIVVTGIGLGVMVTRRAVPEYEVRATVWISNDGGSSRGEKSLGPIRADEVVHQTSWPELMRSFAILEKAVRRLSLYVLPGHVADTTTFAGFDTEGQFRTGSYKLQVDGSGARYKLLDASDNVLEAGLLGDSIGRRFGLKWKPTAAALLRDRTVEFTLVNPREAAMNLSANLDIAFPPESNILRVALHGSSPRRITEILNAVLSEFVSVAADLKKRSVSEAGKALAQQLAVAGKSLEEAESALERFRVQTITLPTEAAQGPNGQRGHDPVFDSFFSQKVEVDNVRRDRAALDNMLAAIRAGTLDPSVLWSLPAVQNSPAPELKSALADFSAKQAALRTAQRTYTDDHKIVRDLRAEVEEIKTQTIPRLLAALSEEQRQRELSLASQVQGTEAQLRGIPTRSMEESRLRREVEARGALYAQLNSKFQEAALAEASTIADVSILDAPTAPERPSQNRSPHIIFMAVLGSIGIAIAVALLLDQIDRRFRYPEQATHEMGLDILGVVPELTQTVPDLRDPLEAAHAREAFRTIRLAVMHAFEAMGRSVLTVSSPAPGDGKSLLSANLAVSFAEANFNVLLVDGDIRRGSQHTNFGVARLPGFVDYLAGGRTLDEVLRPTNHERLTLLPRGASQLHGPEMLISPAMSALLAELEQRYDVIIVDSPPLGAGIDPFVLGTVTGAMLLVLRSGETDKRMAQAKLKILNKLPIRVLGAVLNAIHSEGDYRYYSYLYSDLTEDAHRQPAWPAPPADLPLPPSADVPAEETPLQPS